MAKAVVNTVLGVLLVCVLGFALASCGDADSTTPSGSQLEKAREEGERSAQERARVDELEEEVRGLKRTARNTDGDEEPRAVNSTPAPSAPREPELLRSFHAPSGNVSCAITSDGAFCTVSSIETTFRFEGGNPGQIESGSALPRSFGESLSYGSTISAGSISCTIPSSNEARGVVCSDTSSGHGFEASRVTARQNAY